MSGAQQITFMNQRSFIPPVPAIGAAYEGGFFAGQISMAGNGIATHNLVVAPLSSGQSTQRIRKDDGTFPQTGTGSVIDGPQNTAVMTAGGANTFPAAGFTSSLSIGGYNDWYIPAFYELAVIYFNLKPTTQSNNPASGINPNAVPAIVSDYSAGNPAQTTVAVFQSDGIHAFSSSGNARYYVSSTERFHGEVWRQRMIEFNDGIYNDALKSFLGNIRAIRRVAL